jgi:anti-sigma factor RsiW
MKPEQAAKLLHAYVDGELDPSASIELEACLAADPALRAASERLRAMSAAIREKADYHSVPDRLAARLVASLPREGNPRSPLPVRRRWLAAAGAFATLAAIVFAVVQLTAGRADDERLMQELLSSHGRAVLAGRMIDIASAEQHTVKPWLSARLPFSPPVADLAKDGFPLAGGRLDYAAGRPVAVLLYKRREHSIEAFIWPGARGAARLSRDGLNFESFSRDGMTYWLVSDLDRHELDQFARALGKNP